MDIGHHLLQHITLSHLAEELRILDTEEVASSLLGPLMILMITVMTHECHHQMTHRTLIHLKTCLCDY